MLLNQPISLNFENIRNTRTVLFSAERHTVIESIRIFNRSKDSIRVSLKIVDLSQTPEVEVFIFANRLLQHGQSDDGLLLSKGSNCEIIPHRMLDKQNLICYSNQYSSNFDCIVTGYELVETIE